MRQGRTLNHSCTNNLAPEEVTVLDTLVGRGRASLKVGGQHGHASGCKPDPVIHWH
jgi:hypothetical protein